MPSNVNALLLCYVCMKLLTLYSTISTPVGFIMSWMKPFPSAFPLGLRTGAPVQASERRALDVHG